MSLRVVSIGAYRGIGAWLTHGALPMRILLFHTSTITAPHKAVAPVVNPLPARVTEKYNYHLSEHTIRLLFAQFRSIQHFHKKS